MVSDWSVVFDQTETISYVSFVSFLIKLLEDEKFEENKQKSKCY